MSKHNKTSVIVIGGSLVGLSTALFLASWKVPVILLERHPSSSPHPRAIGYTTRTIELLRAAGIQSRLPVVEWKGGPPRRITVQSLEGEWQDEKLWTPKPAGPPNSSGTGKKGGPPGAAGADLSPVVAIATAQDKIEPVLRESAAEFGADLRLGHKVTEWSQDEDGVKVTAVDKDGVESTFEAQYLVACDGARSPVRESLGIQRSGVGHLRVLRSILFHCPQLDKYLETGFAQFQIEGRDDGFECFVTTYGSGRWAVMWNPSDKSEATRDAMDEATQRDTIRKAVGKHIQDDEIDLITTGEWQLSGLVADQFSSGRIFLAGDAAHALPPNRGGYGANTGISDAHNLAWKLASVLSGVSRPELLETYDAERRPVARVRHDQIFLRDDYSKYVADRDWPGKDSALLDDVAMELGQIYRSQGVLGADESLPPAKRPDEWAGQPGTRAPHVPLRKGGEAISSLDLFYHGWVLVSNDGTWEQASKEASDGTGVDVAFVHVGKDVAEVEIGSVERNFGIGETGAAIVRPDGYVAWRVSSKPAEPQAFKDALRQVSFAAKGH